MDRVFRLSEARANDRLVLLAIADEAADDGTKAYPSLATLAEKVRLPKRTVIRCVERLEALGELVVVRPERNGRGHFNVYTVLVGKGDTLASEPEKKGVTVSPESSDKRREKVRDPSQNGTDPRPIDQELPPPAPPAVQSEERRVADAMVRAWWDAQKPKPVGTFIGKVQVVQRFLEAGWEPMQVAGALRDSPVVSDNALTFQLNRANGHSRTRAPTSVDESLANIRKVFG